jgi:pilus assembly protein Flp/PilA
MLQLLTHAKLAVARLFDKDEGQGLVEYGLILAFIAVVAVLALTFLGGSVSNALSTVGNSVA